MFSTRELYSQFLNIYFLWHHLQNFSLNLKRFLFILSLHYQHWQLHFPFAGGTWWLTHFSCVLRLINKLQPGSVAKISQSKVNWHKVRPNQRDSKQSQPVSFQSHQTNRFVSFSAAGKHWEFHQSHPGLWPEAERHLRGQRPFWKRKHDPSPDHADRAS